MSFDSKEIRCWKKVYEADLENIIIELKEAIKDPAVIILSGVVGAGKTTFTKKFVDVDDVTSPTYSIINDAGECVHADFYRIESLEDIIHLEIPLYIEDKKYFLVEWGDQYLNEIYREVGDEYSYYRLSVEVNEANADASLPNTRNFLLSKLSL